ncbi:hypothetical protein ONS95_003599 [Cadophora gregata]|uniref:uncharacterized protein n=1 Tax=Cadophora gregata TaxID=51156 RepID=UPI0026DB3A84|nr:uncharacterized protein ONS95_003599 [Cadophora gregata]KAK0106878.1 hypothetical protein ONS95_003599 [Cadophora gregata]KAK0116566.1 hypothetical protein ONS96_012424 [Cadophora gregata f. sp. sojae]
MSSSASPTRQLRFRTARSANIGEAAATRAYVECVWDLAKATQEAIVFKVQIKNIEKQIKEVIDNPWGPHLTEGETHELNKWRNQLRPKMLSWVTNSEVRHLRIKCAELYNRYVEERGKKGLGAYEAPTFIINCLESQERLHIQRKFDINRESLIMANPESELSHQQITDLRAAAGRGRAVYRGCSLIKSEYTVEKELLALQAAGSVVNSYKAWIPISTARLAGTDVFGAPLIEDPWMGYFTTLGYLRLEELLATPVQPLPAIPVLAASSIANSCTDRGQHTQPQSSRSKIVWPQPPAADDDDDDARDLNPLPPHPPAPEPIPVSVPVSVPSRTPAQRAVNRAVSPWRPAYAPFPPPAPLQHPPFHPAPPPPPPAAPVNHNNPFGRPLPYNPTYQQPLNHPETNVQTKWNKVRGNTPAGIDVFYYDKLYNRKDSIHKVDRNAAKMAREDGTTRDLALAEMVQRELLPQGFRDVHP